MNLLPIINTFKTVRLFLIAGLLCLSVAVAQGQNTQTVDNGTATTAISISSGSCSYTWVNDSPKIGLAASGSGNIASFTAVNTGTKPITAKITATPTSDGYAYIANSGTNNVSVYNVATHAFVTNIKVGKEPWGVSVSNDGTRVYVVDNDNTSGFATLDSVSVIDATSNTVIATIPVGSNAKSLVASPDGKHVYVTNETSNLVSVIDVSKNAVTSTIQIPFPVGVAMNGDGSLLYVLANTLGSTGTLYVVNASNNVVVKTVAVGLSPTGIAVSPDGSKIYITNDDASSISVVDAATYAVNTVPVGLVPYALTVTPTGDKVYVSNSQSNNISVVNTSDYSVTTISLPASPQGISASPNGKEVYVAGENPNQVYVINKQTNSVLTLSAGGTSPISIGNFVSAGIGCNAVPLVFSITVNPPPSINDPGSTASASTYYGTPSTAQVINVSGNGLKAPITVTAPAGFEISKDDITYTTTLSVAAAGDTSVTQVFVRIKAAADAGNYNGDVLLQTTGATSVNSPVEGTVLPAELKITADNKTKFYGDPNPVLTVSYTGFENGDGAAQLSTQPVITTTAITSSPIGEYPINVSGALDKNYTISYAAGLLAVVTGDVTVPNAFTPNSDGINDTWEIKNLNLYTTCTVEVLNRYGQKVFYANGYAKPWNGTINGEDLPVGTYYYIIKLKPDTHPLTGYLNIIR